MPLAAILFTLVAHTHFYSLLSCCVFVQEQFGMLTCAMKSVQYSICQCSIVNYLLLVHSFFCITHSKQFLEGWKKNPSLFMASVYFSSSTELSAAFCPVMTHFHILWSLVILWVIVYANGWLQHLFGQNCVVQHEFSVFFVHFYNPYFGPFSIFAHFKCLYLLEYATI